MIKDKWIIIVILLITLLASFLRIYQIDRPSLWYDEGISVTWAQMQAVDIIRELKENVHPPLYFLLLHMWLKLGANDFWARLLSAIFGIASIPLIYILGNTLFCQSVGIFAALFLAISPFHIQYSQEVRAYSLYFFMSLSTLLCLTKAIKANKWIYWLGYALSGALLLYTHEVGPLYLMVFSIFLLIKGKAPFRSILKRWISANFAIFVLFLPWVQIFFSHVKKVSMTFWASEPTFQKLFRLLIRFISPLPPSPTTIISFISGKDLGFSISNNIWLISFLLLFLSAIFIGLKYKKREIISLFFVFLVPVLIIFVFSISIRPIFLARVMIPSLLSVPILLSAGFVLMRENQESNRKIFSLAIVATAIFTTMLSVYSYTKYFEKENWKRVAYYYIHNQRDGDGVVFLSFNGKNLFDWYLKENKDYLKADKIPLPYIKKESDMEYFEKIKQSNCKRIWFILTHKRYADPLRLAVNWFDNHFKMLDYKKFYGVEVFLYQRL